jgi:hypothetical protein
LTALGGGFAGQVALKWTSVRKARSYLIQTTTVLNTTTGWRLAAIATKSKTTVEGLSSGAKPWFRVAALGAAGAGPWREVVAVVVR